MCRFLIPIKQPHGVTNPIFSFESMQVRHVVTFTGTIHRAHSTDSTPKICPGDARGCGVSSPPAHEVQAF